MIPQIACHADVKAESNQLQEDTIVSKGFRPFFAPCMLCLEGCMQCREHVSVMLAHGPSRCETAHLALHQNKVMHHCQRDVEARLNAWLDMGRPTGMFQKMYLELAHPCVLQQPALEDSRSCNGAQTRMGMAYCAQASFAWALFLPLPVPAYPCQPGSNCLEVLLSLDREPALAREGKQRATWQRLWFLGCPLDLFESDNKAVFAVAQLLQLPTAVHCLPAEFVQAYLDSQMQLIHINASCQNSQTQMHTSVYASDSHGMSSASIRMTILVRNPGYNYWQCLMFSSHIPSVHFQKLPCLRQQLQALC